MAPKIPSNLNSKLAHPSHQISVPTSLPRVTARWSWGHGIYVWTGAKPTSLRLGEGNPPPQPVPRQSKARQCRPPRPEAPKGETPLIANWERAAPPDLEAPGLGPSAPRGRCGERPKFPYPPRPSRLRAWLPRPYSATGTAPSDLLRLRPRDGRRRAYPDLRGAPPAAAVGPVVAGPGPRPRGRPAGLPPPGTRACLPRSEVSLGLSRPEPGRGPCLSGVRLKTCLPV